MTYSCSTVLVATVGFAFPKEHAPQPALKKREKNGEKNKKSRNSFTIEYRFSFLSALVINLVYNLSGTWWEQWDRRRKQLCFGKAPNSSQESQDVSLHGGLVKKK